MDATRTRAAVVELGSTSIRTGARGDASPSGTLHLVDGWQPLCGVDRVRFVFPGREAEADETCAECRQAVAAPARRPRPATATRSRAKAS